MVKLADLEDPDFRLHEDDPCAIDRSSHRVFIFLDGADADMHEITAWDFKLKINLEGRIASKEEVLKVAEMIKPRRS